MRVLLDECLPRRLRRELAAYDVQTVPEMGWAGLKNGRLLHLAASHFDVFLTVDGSIEHQQNVSTLEICVVTLRAKSNDIEALLPLMPAVRDVLLDVEPGQVVTVREATSK
ncbi:MAG: hypothetical protein OXE53_16390 [Deltaproteobacteria bacterium]|nr:hypothetical protein [Deltaproteobacteria bacterium]